LVAGRIKADEEMLASIVQVTDQHREGDVILQLWLTTMKFRPATKLGRGRNRAEEFSTAPLTSDCPSVRARPRMLSKSAALARYLHRLSRR
jgi:hypothetical protein